MPTRISHRTHAELTELPFCHGAQSVLQLESIVWEKNISDADNAAVLAGARAVARLLTTATVLVASAGAVNEADTDECRDVTLDAITGYGLLDIV